MEKFRIFQVIGKGAYSLVYRAINTETQQQVAIKAINFNSSSSHLQKLINRQIQLLFACNQHPNIIKLYEVYRKNSAIYLVFEHLPMSLLTFYKKRAAKKLPLVQSQIIHIMRQICQGLKFLHSNRIIHRDLKPQNILIYPQTMEIKLIDFGFAKTMINEQHTKYVVTRWYRPLEILLQLPYNNSVDIFSLGCIFLELLLSKEIFRSQSSLHQLSLICLICGFPKDLKYARRIEKFGLKSCHFPKALIFQIVQKIPAKLAQIITKMMSSTPDQRPTIHEILNHRIFRESLQRSNRFISRNTLSKISISARSSKQSKQSQSKSQIIISSGRYKKNHSKRRQQDQYQNKTFNSYSTIMQSRKRASTYLNSRQKVQRPLFLSKQLNKDGKKEKVVKGNAKSQITHYSNIKKINALNRSLNGSSYSQASTQNPEIFNTYQII